MNKPRVTTFKSVAKRMKKQKKARPVTKQTQDQIDDFDRRFKDMQSDCYWGY